MRTDDRRASLQTEAFSSVLTLIHQAAISPAGWEPVLRRLADLTGCVAGGLTVERFATRQGSPLTFFGFDPQHVSRCFDQYLPLNPLFNIERRMQRGFLVTNGDVVPLPQFRRSDFFNGWARPQGLCSPVTVVLHRTTSTYVPLTLVRPDGTGEVTKGGRATLSRFIPHLVHAMDVAVRLQSQVGTSVLEGLPHGAVLVDETERVVFANAAAEELLQPPDAAVFRRAGRLTAREPGAARRLQAAVAAGLGSAGPARGAQVSIPQAGGEGPLRIRVTPLPRVESVWQTLHEGGLGSARCLVLLSGADTGAVARQYGLTPAEARVMAAIVVGKGLTAAARDLGIARSTAQSHLDKIFQKTSTNRQAELVSLVKGEAGS